MTSRVGEESDGAESAGECSETARAHFVQSSGVYAAALRVLPPPRRTCWWPPRHRSPRQERLGKLVRSLVGFLYSAPCWQQSQTTSKTPGRPRRADMGCQDLIFEESGFSTLK